MNATTGTTTIEWRGGATRDPADHLVVSVEITPTREGNCTFPFPNEGWSYSIHWRGVKVWEEVNPTREGRRDGGPHPLDSAAKCAVHALAHWTWRHVRELRWDYPDMFGVAADWRDHVNLECALQEADMAEEFLPPGSPAPVLLSDFTAGWLKAPSRWHASPARTVYWTARDAEQTLLGGSFASPGERRQVGMELQAVILRLHALDVARASVAHMRRLGLRAYVEKLGEERAHQELQAVAAVYNWWDQPDQAPVGYPDNWTCRRPEEQEEESLEGLMAWAWTEVGIPMVPAE